MPLFQITVPVSADCVESLEDLLFEIDDGHWNIYFDQIAKQGQATGIFEEMEEALETWSWQKPLFEEILGSVEANFGELPDRDWKDSYKDHFKAWSFEGLHWVPIWERENFQLSPGDAVVWLDPGMAFGTGNHETTRLCIESLIEYLKGCRALARNSGGLTCCDAGCGSGILAISARMLGVSEVYGFDNDPDAIRVSIENTSLNGLGGQIDFQVGDLESGFKNRKFDVVLANILASVLMQFPRRLLGAVKPGGRLILSGILASEAPEVTQCFSLEQQALGLNAVISSHALGEWTRVVIDF